MSALVIRDKNLEVSIDTQKAVVVPLDLEGNLLTRLRCTQRFLLLAASAAEQLLASYLTNPQPFDVVSDRLNSLKVCI